MSSSIEFQDVYRHFGKQDVLRGLSFSVQPGQVFALLGRNGAGKTTALRVLLGFLHPMRGHTFVMGVDSRHLSPEDRGRIGYVSEGQKLYANMRIIDAVRFEAGTRPRFDRAYAEKAVARCGLSRSKFIGFLSRGQRAQLALILSVAGSPEVLVFDDPAMGLDVVMRRELLDVMIDLLSDQGVTVLFSSHILTDVERIADRVGILHEGRLIVDATMEDLKGRVQKRHWRPDGNGSTEPPPLDGLLRARRVGKGFDLTLLDFDPAQEERLLKVGAKLSDPYVPSLEDLFLDLTTKGDPLNLRPDMAEVES